MYIMYNVPNKKINLQSEKQYPIYISVVRLLSLVLFSLNQYSHYLYKEFGLPLREKLKNLVKYMCGCLALVNLTIYCNSNIGSQKSPIAATLNYSIKLDIEA